MANALYAKAKESLLKGEFALDVDNLKVALVDTNDYTVNLATHQFLTDVTGAGIVATSANLTGVTVTNGVLDASDVTLSGVSGDPSETLVIYQDTGVAGTSRLLAYVDTWSSANPVTPNGGDITIQWNASGILSL